MSTIPPRPAVRQGRQKTTGRREAKQEKQLQIADAHSKMLLSIVIKDDIRRLFEKLKRLMTVKTTHDMQYRHMSE